MNLITAFDSPISSSLHTFVDVVGLIAGVAGIAAAYWAYKAVSSSKLRIADEPGDGVRLAGSGLCDINAGGETETIDLQHIGFITDLKVEWQFEGKNALSVKRTISIENLGRGTARKAKLYVPAKGLGFEISIDGGQKAKSTPVISFVRKPLDAKNIVVKEIGDLSPGIKCPVTLRFHFHSRTELRRIYPDVDSQHVALHDYYLSDEGGKPDGKIMWLNLTL